MTDYRKEFIKELSQMAYRSNIVEVFGDAVGMMAATLWKATLLNGGVARRRARLSCDAVARDPLRPLWPSLPLTTPTPSTYT